MRMNAVPFACLIVATRLVAQGGTIHGRVTALASGRPVVGATVVAEGSAIIARADSDGQYSLANVSPGVHLPAC